MFDGNIWGDIIGILFYMLFQFSGIWMINRILAKEQFSIAFRCLIGSVAGTLAFQWFPILFAFALGFGIAAHLLGMCLQILVCLVVWRRTQKRDIMEQQSLSERSAVAAPSEGKSVYRLDAGNFIVFYLLSFYTYDSVPQ